MIPITWPFAVWGLDMVGHFKRSKDKKTHLLVAVDKFTKWVEAEPVSKCDAATAVQFMEKVIFRFGFPHSIITDNGTNLSKGAMEELSDVGFRQTLKVQTLGCAQSLSPYRSTP